MPPFYYYKNQKIELVQFENRFLIPFFSKDEYETIEKVTFEREGFRLRKGISNTAFLSSVENKRVSLEEISVTLNKAIKDLAKDDSKPLKVYSAFKAKGNILGVNNGFVIKFKKLSDSKREGFQELLKKNNGIRIRKIKRLTNTFLFETGIIEPNKLISFVNDLHLKDYIEYAHPDFLLKVELSAADPFFNDQWGLQENGVTPKGNQASVNINIQPAWEKIVNLKIQLNPVGILIIDKGIDNHIDYNITLNRSPVSGSSHGTEVAGIIGAISNNGEGIAGIEPALGNTPKFKLYGKNFPDEYNTPETDYDFYQLLYFIEFILLSIEESPDETKVINMSFNFPHHTYVETLDYAITRLSKQFLIINSAGNFSYLDDRYLKYPSKNKSILSVGSVDYKGHWVSRFNYDWGSCYGEGLDLCAPGIEIVTTSLSAGMYSRNFQGTSASVAFVSGVAALLFSIKPDLLPEEAKEILRISADSNSVKVLDEFRNEITDTVERQLRLGMGLLDADKALGELINRYPEIVPIES